MKFFKIIILGLISTTLLAKTDKGYTISSGYGVSSRYTEAVTKIGYQFNEKYSLFMAGINRADKVDGAILLVRRSQSLDEKLTSYFDLGYLGIKPSGESNLKQGVQLSLGIEQEFYKTEKINFKYYLELNSKIISMYDSYANKTVAVGIRMVTF